MTDATPPIPFHPTPDTFVGWPMPPSVPDGMRLELSRSKLLDGAEGEFENWMAMLHERYDECVATLAAERMAFEATFLNKEADGSWWMYHLQLRHEDSPGLQPDNDLDRAHIEFARRTKQRGWEELKPELLLVPDDVREAIVRSAVPPR
jgi:hypothetical protein